MNKAEIEPTLMVCGDNSLGQLWCRAETEVATKFTEANSFPYQSKISRITQVSAYNQSIAFCFDDSQILFRNELKQNMEYSVQFVKKVCCLDKNVLVLLNNGRIYDCVTGETSDDSDFTDLSASKTYIAAVKSNGSVVLLTSPKSKQTTLVKSGCVKVGCTESEVFMINDNGKLKVSADNQILNIPTNDQLLSVSTSETEALFIDVNGVLWRYNYQALTQVYGLPPVIYAAVGVQHYAAISFDGSLYTWGFNPSGQLGIGSDRPSLDPIKVLENVRMVCCGTHHTLAIRGKNPDMPQHFNKEILTKFASAVSYPRFNISRAEFLC